MKEMTYARGSFRSRLKGRLSSKEEHIRSFVILIGAD